MDDPSSPTNEARTIRPGADWKPGDADYTDIRYEVAEVAPGGMVAKITICRPEVRNAFRPRTLFELTRRLRARPRRPRGRRDRAHRRGPRGVLLGR